MKIKHFAGYGFVEAKKISKTKFLNETELKIQVKGNHEWGLERDDSYDLYNWLVKRFDKSVKPYHEMWVSFGYSWNSDYVDGVEVCTYTFTYKS